ncbi:MAG: hypothetical protein ABL933_10025 [Methyloglobulus sp.]|nr:hypothetical protein [Methyloglobulus sp.]
MKAVALCFALPAYAQTTGLAAFAFTPFSAGLVGGVITGMFSPNTGWNKFGLFIWFSCWVFLYTTVAAFLSDHPLNAIPTALGISGLLGIIPFVLTFSVGRFLTKRLRAFIVTRVKS